MGTAHTRTCGTSWQGAWPRSSCSRTHRATEAPGQADLGRDGEDPSGTRALGAVGGDFCLMLDMMHHGPFFLFFLPSFFSFFLSFFFFLTTKVPCLGFLPGRGLREKEEQGTELKAKARIEDLRVFISELFCVQWLYVWHLKGSPNTGKTPHG